MGYSVLVIAAGKKAGEGVSYEKALATFKGNVSVLEKTLSVFMEDENCKQIVVVTNSADLSMLVKQTRSGKIIYVKGGRTRQDSVSQGLLAISEDIVLIHDGVRPWIRQQYINTLLNEMTNHKAAVLAVPIRGVLRYQEEGYLGKTLDTADIYSVQTPQAYHTDFVIGCYRKATKGSRKFTDDSLLVSSVSDEKIAVVSGDERNTRFVLKNN